MRNINWFVRYGYQQMKLLKLKQTNLKLSRRDHRTHSALVLRSHNNKLSVTGTQSACDFTLISVS